MAENYVVIGGQYTYDPALRIVEAFAVSLEDAVTAGAKSDDITRVMMAQGQIALRLEGEVVLLTAWVTTLGRSFPNRELL